MEKDKYKVREGESERETERNGTTTLRCTVSRIPNIELRREGMRWNKGTGKGRKGKGKAHQIRERYAGGEGDDPREGERERGIGTGCRLQA